MESKRERGQPAMGTPTKEDSTKGDYARYWIAARIDPTSQFLKAKSKGNTLKKFAVALLLALTCSLHANAQYISEIKQSFSNQTALLSASSILSAPGSDASYLICSYLGSTPSSQSTVYAVLRWTDEHGNSQSYTFPAAATGSTAGCVPIRNESGTAPTIETDGTYSSGYNEFVVGFGFWNVSPNKEGGITEPISADYAAQTSTFGSTTILSSTTYSTSLVVLTLASEGQSESVTATLNWTDEKGAQSASVNTDGNSDYFEIVIPVRLTPGSTLTLSTAGTVNGGYDLHVRGVTFGTPATGSGPLALSTGNYLNWTNELLPTTVVTAPSSSVYLICGNIAQASGSSYGISLTSNTAYPLSYAFADTGGDPGTFLAGSFVASGAAIKAATNTDAGFDTPTYSAEFNVLQF
jgi:hypothetical protein